MFSAVGWFVGGLSLLYLTKDLTTLELHGIVRDGFEAYRALAGAITGFLFGWIDWWWVSITDFEAHLLILSVVFASAAARATPYHGMMVGHPSDDEFSAFFVYYTFFIVPIFLSFLLLPGALALVPGIFWMALMIYGLSLMKLDHRATGESVPFAPHLAAELFGVFGFFLLIIAVNYALAGTA